LLAIAAVAAACGVRSADRARDPRLAVSEAEAR
jgi:hypothetical protein